MRFRTRAFLLIFIPFSLLLAVSFFMVQRLVQSAVRDGLRSSLRENHRAVARIRARSDLQNSRFLNVAGENSALKAGARLLLSMPSNAEARATLEDQLRDLCERMGFDLLLFSTPDGAPIAGVVRAGANLNSVDMHGLGGSPRGLTLLNGKTYQVASVDIDQSGENLGALSVGELFDFSEFTTPAVLMRDGHVVKSSLPRVPPADVEAALRNCAPAAECEVYLAGAAWISLPLQSLSLGGGYVLRSLQNFDSASDPVREALHRVFILVALVAALIAMAFTVVSSRSIVRPIGAVVAQLRKAEETGVLPEFGAAHSSVREIGELTQSFDRAAASIREGRRRLQKAYVEFVQSLASALDARDRSTAGHSDRVSRLGCQTAAAMGLGAEEIDKVRIGALLHDIGKIGVSDRVLQKPGRLTEEEFALIKQHPGIGRRILEGVQGFTPYLSAVELHHENWDGTGYPHGQTASETPIEARIIHVVDAYDAMTADRPYRNGMSHGRAIEILRGAAGTQFDPRVVEVFTRIHGCVDSVTYAEAEPQEVL